MRDPRIDPQPGDLLSKAGVIRYVTVLHNERVEFESTDKFGRKRRNGTFYADWRNWCRGSDVVTHPDSRAGELIPEDGA